MSVDTLPLRRLLKNRGDAMQWCGRMEECAVDLQTCRGVGGFWVRPHRQLRHVGVRPLLRPIRHVSARRVSERRDFVTCL